MNKERFGQNELLKFGIDIMKNLAIASATAGAVAPVFNDKINFLVSLPSGLFLMLSFMCFANLLIKRLWTPDELLEKAREPT